MVVCSAISGCVGRHEVARAPHYAYGWQRYRDEMLQRAARQDRITDERNYLAFGAEVPGVGNVRVAHVEGGRELFGDLASPEPRRAGGLAQ